MLTEKQKQALTNLAKVTDCQWFELAVDDYGEKAVGGCVMKSPSKVWQKPILRGFAYLFYGLSAYFNAYIEMKGLQGQEEQNKSFKIAGKINIAS